MRRALILVGTLVMTGSGLVAAAPSEGLAAGTAGASLVSSSYYNDGVGYTHVVGEFLNTGNVDETVAATVQFYNGSGTLVGSDTTYANETLAPGEKSPFHDIKQTPAGFD